ncbi:hypothetical protein O6H91_22G043300 [Diphasiastrum complanatum]|uniref:Uncharacterized protein n=1 Tax=Diphasiastrum complanatum TaxID=34168 RepID=A0ACC2AF15_DIPCM|nr:hypothetical protein O6H91_22G043300 [Diphasiastrum complanatum]
MSDDDHHFESKADAGASKTFPQQAGTIRKNAYIVIKQRPCKVVEVSTSKTGKHGHAKCHFVGIDIFTGKKLEDIVPSSHNCDVPEVIRTDYQLIDISEDGLVFSLIVAIPKMTCVFLLMMCSLVRSSLDLEKGRTWWSQLCLPWVRSRYVP